MPSQIYVDNILFLGRVEEQKQFRAALKEVIDPPTEEIQPYIFLLFGDGGMGKTTLAKRFRDIAKDDHPFEGEFQILWVDWEDERKKYAALQVGREHIRPETVFDILHAKTVNMHWTRYFREYQDAIKKRAEAEKQATVALSSIGERDDLVALRGAGAGAVAKILRLGLPIGDTGEKLAKAFLEVGIKVGVEQAAHLRNAIEVHLRARLNPKQFDFFLHPNEQLARALADGFKKVSNNRPAIIFLDTYEIIDRADIWLRVTMQNAGPNIVWVLCGRDNLLRSRAFGGEYFKGYAEDFPRRLIAYDMRQLAEQDVRELFASRAPKRELDNAAVKAISVATRGIPLALSEAAEMWFKGNSLAEIVGDTDEHTPRMDIVHKMTARYLLHAVEETDKQSIYALMLADGDIPILRAMIHPDDGSAFNLDKLLQRLERDYSSVHYERARLYDDPAFFLKAYLKEEVRRTEDRIISLNQRAVIALRERLAKIQTDLPQIEDRCEDDEWLKTVLDLTEHLFWLDESEAWHWLVQRYVEGIAYSSYLRHGLLQVASSWQACLSRSGKNRLNILRAGDSGLLSPDDHNRFLNEIAHAEQLGWLKGEGEDERKAILDWQRGWLLFHLGQCSEALKFFERAERGLPENGIILRQRLGEALYHIAGKLMWPDEADYAVYSTEAEQILPKVVAWLPEKQYAWYRLGTIYGLSGKLEDALGCFDRAIALDPKFARAYNGIGNIRFQMGQYDAAISAYRSAIELDPMDINPQNGLGNIYYNLGQYDDAYTAYKRAIDINPQKSLSHLNIADVYHIQGKHADAMREYKEGIRLAPNNSFSPLVCLGIIARFQGLVESDHYFTTAMAQWANALKARRQNPKELLENKALALLCLGRKGEALNTLQQAIEQMLPCDIVDLTDYELLRIAPNPPDGIDEMIEMLERVQTRLEANPSEP